MKRLGKHLYSGGNDTKYYIDCAHYAENANSLEVKELIKNMKHTDVAVIHAVATDETIKNKNRHIVVKISRSKSTVKHEFETGNSLKLLPGFIKYICLYPCYDDTTKKLKDTEEPIPITHQICSAEKNENNIKHVLVMPYIQGGSLVSYNWTIENIGDLKNIMIHTVLSLANAYEKMGFLHNDLNWGNVMFKKTATKTIIYDFGFARIQVPTNGYKVVIMDFEKSYMNKTDISTFWRNMRMFLQGMDVHNKDGDFVSWNNEDIRMFIRQMMVGNKQIDNVIGLIQLIDKSTFDVNTYTPVLYDPNKY